MLTDRQKEQLNMAFAFMCSERKMLFLVNSYRTVPECIHYLEEQFRDVVELQVAHTGVCAKVYIDGRDGLLEIEPIQGEERLQGREFAGVFIDEEAVLDRQTFDLLATRVRPA